MKILMPACDRKVLSLVLRKVVTVTGHFYGFRRVVLQRSRLRVAAREFPELTEAMQSPTAPAPCPTQP